jgi:hypothetical protein
MRFEFAARFKRCSPITFDLLRSARVAMSAAAGAGG